MSTVSAFIESARYDLLDYETGLEFDDRELFDYLNRMIVVMDSTLSSLRSGIVRGTEINIDTVASQDFVNLAAMNNSYWDSIRSVWIGTDDLEKVSIDVMDFKRKWYSGNAKPVFYAIEGQHLIFETTADDAHTDLVIHYNKKSRPRLQEYSDTVVATVVTDILTPASAHTFVTGDGPFQISTDGVLPTGLSASTDYWIIYDASVGSVSFQVATSQSNAHAGTQVVISGTGSGTHTFTFSNSTDMMPYSGRYDGIFREMLVMHARAKKEGQIGQPEGVYSEVFRKRAMEEVIRRGFVPKPYHIDF